MRLFSFLIPFLMSFVVNAQIVDSKKSYTSCFKEISTVDKSTGLKTGQFVKIDRQTKDTLVIGNYQNDERSGLWKYFEKDNKLWMTYDFDNKSLILIPDVFRSTKTFVIKKEDSFSLENVDNPPFYLGSKNEVGKVLAMDIKVPSEILQKTESGISTINLVIGKEGTIKDIVADNLQSKDFLLQTKKAINTLESDWIPAKVNGVPVDAIIPVIIEVNFGDRQLIPENPRCIIVRIKFFGITRTVSRSYSQPVFSR